MLYIWIMFMGMDDLFVCMFVGMLIVEIRIYFMDMIVMAITVNMHVNMSDSMMGVCMVMGWNVAKENSNT